MYFLRIMKTVPALLLLFLPGAMRVQASALIPDTADSRITMRSTMVGIGTVNRLETYLSPMEYRGTEARFLRESMRMTRLLGGKVSVRQAMEGNFSISRNPTHDASYLAGDFDWQCSWHYHFVPTPWLRLLFGAGTCLSAGGVYNTRNGNNPAQGKLSGDVDASVAAICRFSLLRVPFTARWQTDMPLFGLMFSPRYGQSYYEIFSLGHTDRNVCFIWTGNAPTFRNLLTLDTPLGRAGTLRLGWRADIRQSAVNSLKSHTWSSVFMIGYVKHFRLIKAGDADRDKAVF